MTRDWVIWSIDAGREYRGLVVDEQLTEGEAEAQAARRNESAARHAMRTLAFVATPQDKTPAREQVDGVLAGRVIPEPEHHEPRALEDLEAERARIYGPDWRVLLRELIELDAADALAGIAAIVHTRLDLLQGRIEPGGWVGGQVQALLSELGDDSQVLVAALLAAGIDRQGS